MKHIPSPYRSRQTGSTIGKVAATLASLLTIAAILFVGTRDWKSGKSVFSSLADVSDIQGLFAHVEDAASSKTVKNASIMEASNPLERALLEKGTLIRRSSEMLTMANSTPRGLVASR